MEEERKFCFMFYPGEYLRDTNCLSENAQVAYDRIMCEHVRNICVPENRFRFFTKKCSKDEKEDLLTILIKNKDGYQIPWVAEQVLKRKGYVDSRSTNRKNKNKSHKNNISESHHEDMVIVDVKESSNSKGKGKGTGKPKQKPSKKPEEKPTGSKSLNFHHLTSPEFISWWNQLLETKKWKKKIDTALQISLDKMKKYPVEFATQLVKDSFEGGWQGVVFDNTEDKFRVWQRTQEKKTVTVNESDLSKDFRGN